MQGLGKIIRQVRKTKKITLVELAKATGVAQASLSRIETGVMTGTVESHKKIAEALGISLAELYSGLDSREEEITQHEPKEDAVTLISSDVNIELLTLNTTTKKIVPFVISLGPSSETKIDKLERGVERFYWILDGEVTVSINDREYHLKNKNTLYFDASLPHKIRNLSSYPAKIFCATSPAYI